MPTSETKACRDCGATIPVDARVCPQCGARQLTGGKLGPATAAQTSSQLNGCVVAALATFGIVIFIGILAAIAIPKFANTKQKAYVAAMRADLRNIAAAEETYHDEHGRYQERLDSLGVTLSYGVRLARLTAGETGWRAVLRHDAVDTICTTGGGDLKPELVPAGQPVCARPERADTTRQ